MKKKRFLAMILCIFLLIPTFMSCNKTEDQDVDKDRYVYDNKTRETAADCIPDDYSLDNETFSIFYAEHINLSVVGDDETTDIVYSKIHERNLSVQERLSCKLEPISSNTTDWKDVTGVLKRDIQTMSDIYQVVFTTNNTVIQEKLFNYFHDLNDSNYIDITERWWYEDAIYETSVDNYNYRFLYGDININSLGNAGAIYYNKDLYEQYLSPTKDRDLLYQMVLDGTWTFEQLTSLTKKSYISKGGDGSNDVYGYMFIRYAEPIHYLAMSCGVPYYERNEQGIPEITLNCDESISFTEDLYSFIYENEGAFLIYPGRAGEEGNYPNYFENNRLIFSLGTLGNALAEERRAMKSDFGIIPFPKLTEEQDTYYNFMANGTVVTSIPVSTDIDRANEEVSAIIEALASESYRFVAVPFYETALKTAYNRDDLSAQMIDIITAQHDTVKSTLTKNFLYEYGSSIGGIGSIFSRLMERKSTGFSSEYDSVIGPANTGMKELIQLYKDGII